MSSNARELQSDSQRRPNGLPAILPLAMLLIVGYALWQGVYTVEPHEQAVVMRFGKYTSTQGPGLHYKIPIVDRAVLVDMSEHTMRCRPPSIDTTAVSKKSLDPASGGPSR